MRSAILTGMVTCVVALGGCATATQKEPKEPEITDAQAFTCAGTCTDYEVSRAINHAFQRCRNTQNLYERRGFNSKSGQLAVAVVGALAGAVAAPIAKGSGAKAWSGLSGAANGIQTQLDEQFSATIIAQERLAVSDAMVRGEVILRAAEKEANPPKEVFEAQVMAYECSMAAATADAAVANAISTAALQVADNHKKATEAANAQLSNKDDQNNTQNPDPGHSGSAAAPPTVNPATNGKHP